MKILTEWFRPTEFAGMTGILLAMGGIGSLISTAPLAMLTEWLGWRVAFLVVAGLTLVLAGLVWSAVRDRPADFGWQAPVAGSQHKQTLADLKQGVRTVLGSRRFWPLALWFFFQNGIFFAFGGLWGGPYLQQVYALDRTAAGQVLAMLALGLIVGGPLQSWLSARLGQRRKPLLIISSLVTIAVTGLLAGFTASLPLPLLYLICLLMGGFTAASVVIGFAAAKELFPARIAGTAIGLVNLFPFAGGALFQPLLGLILEGASPAGAFSPERYQLAFLLLLAAAGVALVAGLCTRETTPLR